MKKLVVTALLGLLPLLVLPIVAYASGFYNGAQSAKAMSMGNAFVAQADDPTAVFFNPAGIVQLESTQISIGLSTIKGQMTFKSDAPGGTVNVENHVYFVPMGYLTYKVNDSVSLGLGTFSNFGLSADWPDNWEGRFVNGTTLSRLTSLTINPVIAVRPHNKISIAAGPVFQYVDFIYKNRTLNPLALNELDTKFSGNNWGLGFNVGLLVWVTDHIKAGFSYRSQVHHTISDGNLTFSPQVPIPGINLTNTGIKTSLKTPAIIMFGICWNRGPLTVEFDAQWTEWSSFRELATTFNSPVGGQYGMRAAKNWRNAWEYHVGIQYALLDNLFLRAGFIYDMAAVPASTLEPLVPFADRKFYNLGIGYKYKGLTIDASYTYMDGNNSTWNNVMGDPLAGGELFGLKRVTGKFEGINTNLFITTISYKF